MSAHVQSRHINLRIKTGIITLQSNDKSLTSPPTIAFSFQGFSNFLLDPGDAK